MRDSGRNVEVEETGGFLQQHKPGASSLPGLIDDLIWHEGASGKVLRHHGTN